jgi:uncharacterized protein (TIGR02452 family)
LEKAQPVCYPLNGNVIFTPHVQRWRDTELKEDKNGITASFITAAAPNVKHTPNLSIERTLASASRTLDCVFNTQEIADPYHPTLIIGAWGCGAFAPKDEPVRSQYIHAMIELICQKITNWGRVYQRIVIAVPDKQLLAKFKLYFDQS